MRKRIAAGNWKMNKTIPEAVALCNDIINLLRDNPPLKEEHHVVVAPPFTALTKVAELIEPYSYMSLAAQNCYSKPKGAFTGEVSAEMLISAGCTYVILGHSERRDYFIENDDFLYEKVCMALENKLTPIFCCGELLSHRSADAHYTVVLSQLKNTLFRLNETDFSKVVIAYEPVWAIGTGVTATPEQAQDMHCFIRKSIGSAYNNEIGSNTSILYGGSCNAKNAAELFSKPDVDGGLIGGASLIASDFVSIIHSL